MPPRKTADGARAASEAESEDGGPPTDDASPAATAANASSSSNSKPTKQAKGKTGKKGKKEAAPEDTRRCFHCQSESTKMMCCSQCHRAWCCGKPCQKKHLKQHKRACTAELV